MNIIAILFGVACFYIVYLEGYSSIFRRKKFFENHKKHKEFYSHIFFLKWWFDLSDKFPIIEIFFGILIGFVFLIFGILFLIVGIYGPISGSWDFNINP
jgi:hypothetical protein